MFLVSNPRYSPLIIIATKPHHILDRIKKLRCPDVEIQNQLRLRLKKSFSAAKATAGMKRTCL